MPVPFYWMASLRGDWAWMNDVTQGGGNTVAQKRFDFTFKDDSRLASISRFADLAGSEFVAETTFAYDEMGRLLQLWHAQDVTDLAGYDYTYDAASRIEEIDSHVDGVTAYSHDFTGQLTDADHAAQTDEAYTYDENGNRTLAGHVVDANNRLMSATTTTTRKAIASSNTTTATTRASTTPGITATA